MECKEDYTVNSREYLSYKTSGIEWLGDIPMHWEVKKLKFVGEIYSGISGKKGEDFSEISEFNMKPFVPFTNICNNTVVSEDEVQFVKINHRENQNRIKKNDILFLMSSETIDDIAKCSIYLGDAEELYLNSFCKGFRINESSGIAPTFINYLLLSSTYRNYFSQVGRGFIRINLRQEYIKDIPILVTNKEEQQAITDYLDHKINSIDKAINIKQRQSELLKEWNKILINNAVTKGLNHNVKMKDSGIEWVGGIPKHWKVVSNRSLFYERKEPGNNNLPILSVSIHTAVSSSELNEEENLRGRVRIEDKRKYKMVKPGDIVFNMMRAWQGAIGAVNNEGMVSPAYVVAVPKEHIHASYLECQYRTSSYIQQMDRVSKGITDFRKRLYWNEFKQLKTLLPPIEEQKAIALHLKQINNKFEEIIFRNESQIKKLKEYKTILIDKVVTGKIRINDINV